MVHLAAISLLKVLKFHKLIVSEIFLLLVTGQSSQGENIVSRVQDFEDHALEAQTQTHTKIDNQC